MDYRRITVVPSDGDREGAVVAGEVDEVDGGGVTVGLADLAVFSGSLQGEETVEGAVDRRELPVNYDELATEPCCHNSSRSATADRSQDDVPYPTHIAQT